MRYFDSSGYFEVQPSSELSALWNDSVGDLEIDPATAMPVDPPDIPEEVAFRIDEELNAAIAAGHDSVTMRLGQFGFSRSTSMVQSEFHERPDDWTDADMERVYGPRDE